VGDVACMGVMRNLYKIVIGKREGKIPVRRPCYMYSYMGG
jgi:hypothetical protein